MPKLAYSIPKMTSLNLLERANDYLNEFFSDTFLFHYKGMTNMKFTNGEEKTMKCGIELMEKCIEIIQKRVKEEDESNNKMNCDKIKKIETVTLIDNVPNNNVNGTDDKTLPTLMGTLANQTEYLDLMFRESENLNVNLTENDSKTINNTTTSIHQMIDILELKADSILKNEQTNYEKENDDKTKPDNVCQ